MRRGGGPVARRPVASRATSAHQVAWAGGGPAARRFTDEVSV